MTTISVPLTAELLKKIQQLIDLGVADNKSVLVRRALDKYVEDQIIESILKAKNEPSLEGDLDELAGKFWPMKTNVKYKPSFLKQYKKLPQALREEVREKIELFKVDPKHPFLKTHALKGKLKGLYSFSVNYQYRIVFLYETKNSATFLHVGGHEIYR